MIVIQRNFIDSDQDTLLFVMHSSPKSKGISLVSDDYNGVTSPDGLIYWYTKFKLELRL